METETSGKNGNVFNETVRQKEIWDALRKGGASVLPNGNLRLWDCSLEVTKRSVVVRRYGGNVINRMPLTSLSPYRLADGIKEMFKR